MVSSATSSSAPLSGSRSWRTLIVPWYLISLALCLLGAIGHDWLFPPEVWNEWAASQAPLKVAHLPPLWCDNGRAFVAFSLALCGIRWLEVSSERRGGTLESMELARYEVAIISAAGTTVLFFAYYALPANFYLECTKLVAAGRIHATPFTFGQIWLSYVLYSPYVIGLWLGIVFPIFFFLIRSVRDDVREWKNTCESVRRTESTGATALEEVWRCWHRKYDILKIIATHYVPLVIFILLLSVFERSLFAASATALGEGVGSAAMYAMLLAALAISVAVFALYYARERGAIENWLRSFRDKNKDSPLENAAAEKLKELENYSELNFFWAVLTSRGFVLTFLFGVANTSLGNVMPSLLNRVIPPEQSAPTPGPPPSARPSGIIQELGGER